MYIAFVFTNVLLWPKVRVHESYSWYTAYYRPCWPNSADQSLIDGHLFLLRLKPSSCSTADLFVIWKLTYLVAHRSTQCTFPTMSSHTDASKCLHFIHKLYIHSDSTSIFLQHKTTYLIVPEVLVPLLHPLFFCSMSLATYQMQRKIKT
jgi:hypothetical protein